MKNGYTQAVLIFTALAMLALPAANVAAVEASSLYTAEAPLERNDRQGRDAAYANALSQVISRITGLSDPMQTPKIAELFPDPARFVLQYRPGEDDTLWVTFDGEAIERLLRRTDVTVWGSDRPLTLVWLAVDWGNGEREIVAAGDAERVAGEERSIDRNRLLRERVQEAARKRGVPIAFPLLDAEDRQRVSFSDVWGGFDELLLQASRRYGTNSILVGRIRPGDTDRNRWSWYFGGEQRAWTGEAEEVIARLGDTLSSQFAVSGGDQLATFGLTVSGIDSVADYGAVQSFMEQLDVVEELAIDTVSADHIRYRIKAHGGKERLRRVLEFSSMLVPVDNPRASGGADSTGAISEFDTLAFRYRR